MTHTLTGVGARGDAIASKNMYKKLKSLKICIKSNSLKICIKNLYLTSVLREISKLVFTTEKGLKVLQGDKSTSPLLGKSQRKLH